MAIIGTTCWGHSTGVTESNTRTFADHWTGTGAISGAGDAEIIELDSGEYMESEVVQTGARTIDLYQNLYDVTGDDVTLKYRTGAAEDLSAESWTEYTVPFESLGYVQIRLENPSGGIAFVRGATSTCENNVTTRVITMTVNAGELVVVCARRQAGGDMSVSDDADTPNTYTPGTLYQEGSCFSQMFYSKIATTKVNATITVTYSALSAWAWACASSYTGIAASPLDIDTDGEGLNETTLEASSGVLAQANELIVAVAANIAGWTVTPDGDFNTAIHEPASHQWVMDYLVVNSTNSVTYTATVTTGDNWIVNIMTFKGS